MFCNFLLADEINRAPANPVGAARGHAGARVTIGHDTTVPEPFLVMATQNPIESEDVPLPEAQIDRFMLKVVIGYPQHDEELTVVQRQLVEPPGSGVLSLEDLMALQRAVFDIYVDPARQLRRGHRHRDARARRPTACPSSPSTSRTARAPAGRSASCREREPALIRGREYAIVDDLQSLVTPLFRLVLSYQALAEEVSGLHPRPGPRCARPSSTQHVTAA